MKKLRSNAFVELLTYTSKKGFPLNKERVKDFFDKHLK